MLGGNLDKLLRLAVLFALLVLAIDRMLAELVRLPIEGVGEGCPLAPIPTSSSAGIEGFQIFGDMLRPPAFAGGERAMWRWRMSDDDDDIGLALVALGGRSSGRLVDAAEEALSEALQDDLD